MDTEKQFLVDYINEHCILSSPNGLMFGKLPGTRYSRQFYLAKALYNIEVLDCIANQFYQIIKTNIGHFDFQITGREWSACPLLTSIPLLLKQKHGITLNSFMIKRERKSYGLNNFVEGMPNDLPVLVVDDLCNSTDSFRHCGQVLQSVGLKQLDYIFAVVNKYSKTMGNLNKDRYCSDNIKALYIISGDDL